LLLGVDYYPEQWNIDLMEQDMDTIVEMGCNVIRIAEFSWHMMEKREGQFDFSFFDRRSEEEKSESDHGNSYRYDSGMACKEISGHSFGI